MIERLTFILDLVNNWLKFAEAKNAALIAANGVIVFGVYKLLHSADTLPNCLIIYMNIAAAAIAFAGALSLISFLPRTRLPWLGSRGRPSSDDNVLFYGDIASYDAKSYLEALYHRSGLDFPKPNLLEDDYAEQIIVNSRIAINKYRLFSVALWITVSAILTPIITIPLLIYTRSE